jgi:hypothetical protein
VILSQLTTAFAMKTLLAPAWVGYWRSKGPANEVVPNAFTWRLWRV